MRRTVWRPVGALALIALAVFLILTFIKSVDKRTNNEWNWRADLQRGWHSEILVKYENGGEHRGVHYIPPDEWLTSYGRGSYGLYYVTSKDGAKDDDAVLMAMHLLLRASVMWSEEIIGRSHMFREMVGTPQLIYEDGVPVAAYCYYRHVEKTEKSPRSSP